MEDSKGSKKKILIIEDEEPMQKVLTDEFEREGFLVLGAEDGRQGLSMALKERPDIVLLDIVMPEMSGIEVCVDIKNNNDLKDIIVILYSAQIKDMEKYYKDFGADACIYKYNDQQILLETMRNLAEKRGSIN